MTTFNDKDTRKLFIILAIIFISTIITVQIGIYIIMDDYKREMISHDYSIAGYLNKNFGDKIQISNAFTMKKTPEDYLIGQKILKDEGYSYNTSNDLIPIIKSLSQRYAVLAFIVSCVITGAILLILIIFLIKLDKKLKSATFDISSFMDGNYNVRLDGNEEGCLSQLFLSINSMATTLISHIEKEKQNKEFLKNTISDISHQLKTPLAALQMYNEIILDENTQNEAVERFSIKSRNELERMENLIQNLLKLAKLDAGAIELDKRDCNLKELVESAAGRFVTRAQSEDKIITTECNENITLNCDKVWLNEAISNIVKNALDHTKVGDKINILCSETPLSIAISIKDSGTGIHPDDIHSIFKRFYRSRFSKDKQGIGIGLTLSKTIIDKHGGSILVESELDKGTKFTLNFPKLTNL